MDDDFKLDESQNKTSYDNMTEIEIMILLTKCIQSLNESHLLKIFNKYQKKAKQPMIRVDIVPIQ